MERIRLGNNIAISWALYDLNGRVHSLEGKDVQLYVSCGGLKQAVTDYTIQGNVVSWVFLGTEQKKVGLYKLILVETDSLSGAQVVDVAEAFRLVSETLSAVETGEVTKNVSVRSVLTYSNLVGVESVDVVESSEDGGTNLVSIRLVDGNVVEIPIKNGSKGDTGATGATGATGPKGDKGDIGERGPAGIDQVEATVDNAVGTPSVDTSVVDGKLHLDFHNMKGVQGEPAVGIENYVTVEATAQTTAATDVLPATGSADTLYRVACWDGTQYDTTVYSVYGWYDGAYKFLEKKNVGIDDEPTANSQNLVKSGGVAAKLAQLRASVTIINVDDLYPLSSGHYTLLTAIATVGQEYRRGGVIITFFDGQSWQTYQIKSSDRVVDADVWRNTNVWEYRSHFVPASSGIKGINDVLFANPNGCIIELEEGEYSGSTALSYWNGGSAIVKNSVIVGRGPKTVISRNVGYNDVLQNNDGNENNIIKNVSIAHSVSRKSINGVKFLQTIINGTYTDDSFRKSYNILIAASDSTIDVKENADFVCGGSGDESIINNAIGLLSNGGTIFLGAGHYTLSNGINLRTKENICLKGAGKNTVISRASGYCVLADTAISCCISEVSLVGGVLGAGNGGIFIYNCWIGSDYIVSNPNEEKTLVVQASKGIAGINSAIANMDENGGTIVLEKGVYTGTSPISFYRSVSPAGYKKNIRIVGQGKNTIIQRNIDSTDLVADNNTENNIIENVSFAHYISRIKTFPVKAVRLIHCYIRNVYTNESSDGSPMIVNVGQGRFFENISACYDKFNTVEWPLGENYRWEIHIWGHIYESAYLGIHKNHIDLVGHNAIVEIDGGKTEFIRFFDDSGYYGPGLQIEVRNIHFLKKGCFAYWDSPCVVVNSDYVHFVNCTFENATSTPMPFNQADYGVGYEDRNGGRRHGIDVYCYKYDDCKTRFDNCTAIGSPYGTNSCRGWYLILGSPKLFNCVGYGGGFGEFGHGIINHRASRAELHNCIGYAGNNSYRQAAGIRFQACGSSQLVGCIGYPAYGEKLISNGVKVTAVQRICAELGLEESNYINNGVVLFEAVSADSALCAKINNEDIEFVSVGESTEESYGFSFWANSGIARLNDCKGYIGAGERSRALHCIAKSEPTIIGGYFGVEDIMTNTYYKADTGQAYMTFAPTNNQFARYKVRKVAVSILFAPTNGDKLYIETDEQTPKYIVNGFDMTGLSSIVNPTFSEITVPAGVKIKVYVKNGNTLKAITDDSLLVHLAYNYAPEISSALFIDGNSMPIVKGAILRNINDAISVGQSVENIKVFDCLCEGEVDANITFAEKTAINGSSNYRIN